MSAWASVRSSLWWNTGRSSRSTVFYFETPAPRASAAGSRPLPRPGSKGAYRTPLEQSGIRNMMNSLYTVPAVFLSISFAPLSARAKAFQAPTPNGKGPAFLSGGAEAFYTPALNLGVEHWPPHPPFLNLIFRAPSSLYPRPISILPSLVLINAAKRIWFTGDVVNE